MKKKYSLPSRNHSRDTSSQPAASFILVSLHPHLYCYSLNFKHVTQITWYQISTTSHHHDHHTIAVVPDHHWYRKSGTAAVRHRPLLKNCDTASMHIVPQYKSADAIYSISHAPPSTSIPTPFSVDKFCWNMQTRQKKNMWGDGGNMWIIDSL